MIKKFVKKGLNKFGDQIQKINYNPKNTEFTMFKALKRCIDRGLEIKTVIDVGASNGSWSRECLKLLPLAKYLLIEAQEPHKKSLEELKKEKNNVEYILAAAGDREGKIFFDNSDLFGGLAS